MKLLGTNLKGDTNAGTVVLKCLLRPKVLLTVTPGFVSGLLRIQEIQGYHFSTEKVKGKVGMVVSMNEWFVASTAAAVTPGALAAGTAPSTTTTTTMVSGKGGIGGGGGSGGGVVEKGGSPVPLAASPGPSAVGESMVPWQATTSYQPLTPPFSPLWSGLGADMKPAVTAKSLAVERLVFSVVCAGDPPRPRPYILTLYVNPPTSIF